MIKTRFSPSPTGMVHLGNARTALFSALYAQGAGGVFILRIEDTDHSRSEHKFTLQLQEDLRWLGIEWQEGPNVGGPSAPYFQSERSAIYETFYNKLEEMQRAYLCFCTDEELALNRKIQLSRGQPPRYPGTCAGLSKEQIEHKIALKRLPALRFSVPKLKQIEFVDTVKGLQHFKSQDIGDFIIRRADGGSSFMFCNAIDDSLMGVTHVLRGEDHLANTPRQLMILEALGLRAPSYGHLALITNDDSMRLSKRKGSFSLHDLEVEGYLAPAVLNYLARLSHTYESQNLMTFNELAALFRLEKLSRSPARFDRHQLLHWQKEALQKLDLDSVISWLGESIMEKVPADSKKLFAKVMQQNILFPHEAVLWQEILFGDELIFAEDKLAILNEAGSEFFKHAVQVFNVTEQDLPSKLQQLKDVTGFSGKRLFMPLRLALTGETHGPELAQIIELLGHKKVIQRLKRLGA
jgi:nondiscriminating glutamyl-tRNA synthetase